MKNESGITVHASMSGASISSFSGLWRCFSVLMWTLVIPLVACSATMSPSASGMKAVAMPAYDVVKVSRYFRQIAVQNIEIEKTGEDPFWKIEIDKNELRLAMEESLADAGLLAEGDRDAARYVLDATVIETPLGEESGMLTMTAYVAYEVTDRSTGTVIFREIVAGWDRAHLGKKANLHEIAFRNSIERFLSRLMASSDTTYTKDQAAAPVKQPAALDARYKVREPIVVISTIPQEKVLKDFRDTGKLNEIAGEDRQIITPTFATPPFASQSTQNSYMLSGLLVSAIEYQVLESIDEGRKQEAERELAPLAAQVRDLDFREDFWRALLASFSENTWLEVEEVRKTTNPEDVRLQEVTQHPLVTVATAYYLTKDHTFIAETGLGYYLAGTKEPAYTLVFRYFDNHFSILETPEDRVRAWAADNGRAYRMAVNSAIEDTMTVLKSNFINPEQYRQSRQPDAYDPDHVILAKGPGYIVSVPADVVDSPVVKGFWKGDSGSKVMSGDEIRQTFTGMTGVGDHLKKGRGVRAFHATDGSYKRVISDGKVNTGKWWIESNRLCVKLNDKSETKCREIAADGKGGYRVIQPGKDKAVIHFRSLEDGDTI